ncbi:MAG TPA: hypothetical protein VI282_16150 [Verrucomicrobiae bacterium]|jgi:hypothetical protein
MGRAEISWKKRTEEGEKREVYAKHVGDQWLFYSREKRFDDWEPLAQPPLDDWLELLDGVRRRIGRRLLRPEEEERVIKAILLRYPEAEV